MEKITKSSDKVLIDPNEPLILPDGTALVGRVEWFLYALCCLDYQNLPTPMSRIEEFANALITGEILNIQPQSRAEQFFLAILDGNISDLPQPQSRSEVLLDKLARGEFDLSDVEPIQSSYELLLVYLIKNGGIGNIDYVLYEFSEAMKTMYNTVEKPFKSLELSGNTLVNCVLEDTENDDYTSFDKDYSGTSFTINGTSEGAIKSAILSGNSEVVAGKNKCNVEKIETGWIDGANGVVSSNNGAYIPVEVSGTITISNYIWDIRYVYEYDANGTYLGRTKVETDIVTLVLKQNTTLIKIGFYQGTIEAVKNTVKNKLQVEQGEIATECEPYNPTLVSVKMPVLTTSNEDGTKTNILTVNEDVELGSVGGVKDELNLLTGQLTQRTETRPYQEGDELNSEFVTDMTNTRYKLAQEVVKTVDLNVVDQNNTKIDKIHVFDEVTHVNTSSDELTPTVNIGKSVSYPTIIKPNTKYTVDLKRNDKPLTVNLGGTEITFTSGETRKTITTPSTLTNDKLSYYGIGAKCNEIMLIEGEIERNIDYFTGMQSVVMQNQMPILSTVGKNLFNAYKHEFDTSSSQGLRVEILNSNSIRTYCTDTIAWRSAFVFYQLEPHTWYNIRCEASGNGVKQVDINIPEYGNSWNPNITGCTQSNNMLGKFLTDESGKVKISFQGNGSESISYDNTYTNIQIEKISDKNINATSYEPFKTSILSCNDDVTLRGIGDIKDELNLLTGELTERIGEIVLDGSENWIKPSNQPTNTVRFLLTDFPNNRDTKIKSNFKVKKNAMNDEIGIWCDVNTVLNLDTSVDTVDSLKVFLSKNPIKLQYSLATESVKAVDLDVVDQDGNTIPKIKSYKDVTHLEITVPKQSLLPHISAEVATDNSKDMSSLTTKHQEISETQSAIEDNIQSQSDEIDTALMATTEIFESILE